MPYSALAVPCRPAIAPDGRGSTFPADFLPVIGTVWAGQAGARAYSRVTSAVILAPPLASGRSAAAGGGAADEPPGNGEDPLP